MMFVAFACALISSQTCFYRVSAEVVPPGPEKSPWLVGCVSGSSRLHAPKGSRDLDPVACCARCLDEGYQVAELTSEGCYCGNLQHGLVASECFNTSSSGETKSVRGQRKIQSVPRLPVGGGQGRVALYRTEGPFLHSVRLSTSPDGVQAGKPFVVEVSGNLAGRPNQPTGIEGLRGQELSFVTVEFQETAHKGQSPHRVHLLDDGSFTASSDWIFEAPGKYELNVSVSNPLSTLSSTLHLSVSQASSGSPVIIVLHGPLGVPSCIPFQQEVSSSVMVEAAYVGDAVTLRADAAGGLAAEFCWSFAHQGKGKNTEGMKTACLPSSDSLNSTVNWTFQTEGVHVVSVNASSALGWAQGTIHVVVVRLAISDIKASVLGNQLTSGEDVWVEVELFGTLTQLLVLKVTLSAEFNSTDMKDHLSHTDGGDLSNDKKTTRDKTTNVRKVENHSRKMTQQEISCCYCYFNSSNHGNVSHDINLNQNHSNISCHGDTHLHLPSNRSSCYLHLHLCCRLPTTAGQYGLVASVLSTSGRPSVLRSAVLPRALTVYERLRGLRPSGGWKSVVSTHAEFSLEVSSDAGRMGSRAIWTFSLDDVIVMSRTTEEWSVNASLPKAGCYKVTVTTFNPVSRASFCAHILVQEAVGELVLNAASVIGTHQKHSVSFGVTAGSNVTVSLLVNASLLYRSSSFATEKEVTVASLFDRTGTVVVELRAENQVSSQNKTVTVCVVGNRKLPPQVQVDQTGQRPTSQSHVHSLDDSAVQIYAAKQAYPTNTDISFLAVAEAPDPVDFLWHFGDSTSARTTSRAVSKRYHRPGRYDVVVVMSSGRTSRTSDAFPLVVQRAVRLNRLLHRASVLQNQTVAVSCWVNAGTDVTFLWSFGDGASRLGQSTAQHVFHRTGEFRVKVTVSNLVSSASLSSHIFVVDRPCQPPPVKNAGPLKIQVRRSEAVRLGVTYETEVDCDISAGLRYAWSVFDSAGRVFPLPLVDTQRQSLVLPSYLLLYDTYTATARVQVVGSVVYSNYSVKVQVIPSPPVAFIQGGTNIFINNRNITMVTLDGQGSHDPDFPESPVSFSWTCKPVSSISSPCFHRRVPTSSPMLVFPAIFLKHNFDQFQFTLTIRSGERSASSEAFLTLTSNVIGRVSVFCPQCQGDQVSWDQAFSVSAMCEGCDVAPKYIQYTWSLYLVNASSKPVVEVPLCSTVDLSAPSTIVEGPATSTLHSTAADASPYTSTSPPVSPTENASETRARRLNLYGTDSGTLSTTNRKKSTVAGWPEPERSPISPPDNIRTAGLGEEPFHRPPGEFDPPEPLYSSAEYHTLALDNSGVLHSDHFSRSDVISAFPIDSDSSTDWEFSFPVPESGDFGGRPGSDYDVPWMSPEEGEPGISAGRPTGVDGESSGAGDDSQFDPALHEEEGSNLVDPRPPPGNQQQTLLDLPRDLLDRGLFESFTYTGVSSPLLRFRPFSLSPGSRYMLAVTAKSHRSVLGRAQLFVETSPPPRGVMCQVQPATGVEIYTHFSIFCTSGKEDLLYEYSVTVGGRPPRTLYQGRDFQYYFSLPSGDPNHDYKVTIYTEIRSGTSGAATKPCPVTVRVQPSFFRDASSSPQLDPDLELAEAGLRNLSALVQLGNSVEIRNYVSLLSSILNRLSLDAEANAHAQKRVRNVLICTTCELESSEQASMVDNVCILRDLLHVTSQVTLASTRRVTAHVQVISGRFSVSSSAPVWYSLDQKTLDSLVALLSYSLQAAVTSSFTPEASDSADVTQAVESAYGCLPQSSTGVHINRGGSISAERATQLIADVLQTASDLMLKYILFHEAQEHRVGAGLIALYASYQNQTSAVVRGGSAAFYMPASLIQLLSARRSREAGRHRPCMLSVLTELAHSPYTWAPHPGRLRGPVVDLSLYECSTRRKIPVRFLIQPVTIELQQPPRNSSVSKYALLRGQVHYHSFNITQEHLQQAVQLSVAFTPPLNKAFPIMLLFRMFERPTPSMHHLHKIHHWEGNTARLTLPPSYLSAAGVGHLALLNADYGRTAGHKQLSEQVSYSLTVDSSLCLSWDGYRGAWTRRGCRTQPADSNTAVRCSCHQLRPLTVAQQHIHSSHDATDLNPFLSVSTDLTVLVVLLMCVCLYIPMLVVCERADVASEATRRVHYLSDNPPCDPYLYAVTVHTGPCSAARMSAKVYIVLYGEDGVSQTRELQVPGCILFRRNTRDTFILSAAGSLGPVWGVHIWHDNSGPSPNWYLKQVEVSEVNVKGRAWLFVGQCWLAVDEGDGRVERTLRVSTRGIGFAKMLCLKLSDYLAEHHIWISVLRCPSPSPFTRAQRLSVSLLLLLGYACVNAAIVSRTDDQFESGFVDVSAVSVQTGVLSVVAALPAAAIVSFLFRLRWVELTGSWVQQAKDRKTKKGFSDDALSVTDSIFEPHLSWTILQQWAQDALQSTDRLSVFNLESKHSDKECAIPADVVMRKEGALAVENKVRAALQNVLPNTEESSVNSAPRGKELDLSSEGSDIHGPQKALWSGMRDEGRAIREEGDHPGKREDGSRHQAVQPGHSRCYRVTDGMKAGGFRPVSHWCRCLAWTLCLLSSLSCLVLSAVLGMRFSSSKVLLWIHSLFFSLMSCIFLIQPAVIITVAVAVSFWYRKRPDFHTFSSLRGFEIQTSNLWSHSGAKQPGEHFAFPPERCSHLEKLLGARQRARRLRLVRPPTSAELRKSRGEKRRETLIRNTLRDLTLCGCMLLLMLCMNYGSSFTDHYQLNKAVWKQFIRGRDDAFMSVQKHEDWWKWAQTSLLNLLYKNASAAAEAHILIGEPVLWKTEVSGSFEGQVSSVTLLPEWLRLPLSGSRTSTYPQSNVLVPTATPPRTCGLGHTKSDAASTLSLLQSGGWLGRRMVAVKVQFTLFSPAPSLFSSVTMLAERSPTGVLLPSATVQSARVYHTPAVWDYVVMVCQLLFLVLSLLHLWDQVHTVGQQGLMGYWRTPCNWLEVSLLTVTLVYYVHCICHSTIILEVVELLQTHDYREHVDVSLLATWEQYIRTLRGVALLLLTVKCATVLAVNKTLATSAALLSCSLSSLFWLTILVSLILVVALSCVGNLLLVQGSWGFSSPSRCLQKLLHLSREPGAARGLLLSGRDFLHRGVLYLSSSAVWTALAIGLVSSLVRSAKRSQSRGDVLTVAELAGYIRQRVSEFTGQQRRARAEDHVEARTYHFEEFESLVDELLFRLNALSNSLHHTLPPKARCCREEDGPVVSPIQVPSNMDAQDFVRTQITEETKVRGHAETLPASHLLRSKLELKRGKTGDNWNNSPQPGTRENPKGRELQTYSKAQNCRFLSESSIRVWTEDVVEKQVDQLKKTTDSCSLSETQASHMVVEVLIHEEPDKQKG